MGNTAPVNEFVTSLAESLVGRPFFVLARVWLVTQPDGDGSRETEEKFQLAASAGDLLSSEGASSRPREDRHSPLRRVALEQVERTGRPLEVPSLRDGDGWLASPDWAERERIASYTVQPLLCEGEIQGLLALLSRRELDGDDFAWLRTLAVQAGSAIEKLRSMEELERQTRRLRIEKRHLESRVRDLGDSAECLGGSEAMRSVIENARKVALTDASVLILGESGTGKELLARSIHRWGARRSKALITVNCAAVPKDLFESEFFGHVRGAFSGANEDRAGRFQAADGGTLFLDEVGEIPLGLQGKLLRALEGQEYVRVGEDSPRQSDARIIAASNRDLGRDVARGRFRADLYHRLSVFPLHVPPLRERKEDVAVLAAHFLDALSRRLKRAAPKLSETNVAELEAYDWPGNVRELKNAIEAALIRYPDGDLQFALGRADLGTPETPGRPLPGSARILTHQEMKALERENTLRALRAARWRLSDAARRLGVKRTTLSARARRLGIRQEPGDGPGS